MAFLQKLIRYFSKPVPKDTGTGQIYYAHPSHDPRNISKPGRPLPVWIPQPLSTQDLAHTAPRAAVPVKIAAPPGPEPDRVIAAMRDHAKLATLTLDVLQKAGRKGAVYSDVDIDVLKAIIGDVAKASYWVLNGEVAQALRDARGGLIKRGLIGYRRDDKTWYLKQVRPKILTPKEERYLAAKGLGAGWRRIESKIDAITWIYQNLSPDQFEHFCVAILSVHCGVPIHVTEKRVVSGADGGLDGIGNWMINGQMETVTLQAKRIKPYSQLGEDHFDRFAGALFRKRFKYGFYIITGHFSARFKASIEEVETQGMMIELIDQDRLADIMLTRRDDPHGFGLHRTDKGLIYINEAILRAAGRL